MSAFVFLVSPAGRILRSAIGVLLLVVGSLVGAPWGWAIGLFSLVPLLAGIFDLCPVGPIFGAPFRGRQIRSTAVTSSPSDRDVVR